MAAPAQKGRRVWTQSSWGWWELGGGHTIRYIWGRLNSKGHVGQSPPGRVDPGILQALQRFRQSRQQEGQGAIGISKTSDQRCDDWSRGYLLFNFQNRLAGPWVLPWCLEHS